MDNLKNVIESGKNKFENNTFLILNIITLSKKNIFRIYNHDMTIFKNMHEINVDNDLRIALHIRY